MRIKHMLTLAFAAMVAVAFAVPAVASANWTENGSEITGLQWSKDGAPLSGEDGSLSLSGPVRWIEGGVGIECNVNASITLDADSGSGQVNELTASPANCKTSIALNSICGKVTEATAEALPWSVSATESGGVRRVSISGVVFHYKLEGGPSCSSYNFTELTYIGSIVGTPDKSASISSLTLSGSGTVFNAKKEPIFSTKISELSASVTPAGKYGIIKTTRNVAVNGTLGWTSANGGMSCTVNGNLALEAGSEGKVTALNWSNCTLSGGLAFCGKVNSVTSNSLPWGIVDQGSTIKITKFPITVDYSGCSDDTFSGEMLATPNNKSAISSTSLAGTLIRNGAINTSWSGSLNWTPAGVYGL